MPILLAALIVMTVIIGIIVAIVIIAGPSKGLQNKNPKDQDAVLKSVNKRLSQNPRDPEALFQLADIYFTQESWDKAFKTYEILEELAETNPKLDAFEVHFRCGQCALAVQAFEPAYKSFSAAWNIKQDNFEVNYNMGYLEFQLKNYEKAVQYLSLARKQDGEHMPTMRCLGHAFFKLLKYKESMAFIRKAIELAPDDKESLYILGECYAEVGHTDQALRIFTHLRSDPVRGPSASLFAGNINLTQYKIEQAIEDFEFGLKHQNIEPAVLLELRYQLAIACLKQNEIGKAILLLQAVQEDNPYYKDVSGLIERYEELNTNKNLQIFMLAPSVDFVALCRKVVLSYFSKSKTKITNIIVNRNEWVDIIADVETIKWTDLVVFRFIRSQGSIGELTVRDFHSRLKETKAGKGICITVGTFSDEARRFTEARLIDLLEKEQLLPILITVDAKLNNIPEAAHEQAQEVLEAELASEELYETGPHAPEEGDAEEKGEKEEKGEQESSPAAGRF
ncbi:MAG: tetratricopeptide repeat protein [Spirochaetaceae bacterium]|jgi:tetratricopeptide (TPR) repeat protein|nr:tetratricopeptide repeat protein [Spirochaetaceae bacterium]